MIDMRVFTCLLFLQLSLEHNVPISQADLVTETFFQSIVVVPTYSCPGRSFLFSHISYAWWFHVPQMWMLKFASQLLQFYQLFPARGVLQTSPFEFLFRYQLLLNHLYHHYE